MPPTEAELNVCCFCKEAPLLEPWHDEAFTEHLDVRLTEHLVSCFAYAYVVNPKISGMTKEEAVVLWNDARARATS